MRPVKILILLMFFCITGYAQGHVLDSCEYRILLPDHGVFIFPKKDTIAMRLFEKRTIMVFPNNCQGDMYIKEYDDGVLLTEGRCARGEKLLRDTGSLYDPITYEEIIETFFYYEPVKKGIWVTYNKDGTIKEKINYN